MEVHVPKGATLTVDTDNGTVQVNDGPARLAWMREAATSKYINPAAT